MLKNSELWNSELKFEHSIKTVAIWSESEHVIQNLLLWGLHSARFLYFSRAIRMYQWICYISILGLRNLILYPCSNGIQFGYLGKGNSLEPTNSNLFIFYMKSSSFGKSHIVSPHPHLGEFVQMCEFQNAAFVSTKQTQMKVWNCLPNSIKTTFLERTCEWQMLQAFKKSLKI